MFPPVAEYFHPLKRISINDSSFSAQSTNLWDIKLFVELEADVSWLIRGFLCPHLFYLTIDLMKLKIIPILSDKNILFIFPPVNFFFRYFTHRLKSVDKMWKSQK